ncbi:cupin domain-containing protein [Mycobacterium sp. C3-094]
MRRPGAVTVTVMTAAALVAGCSPAAHADVPRETVLPLFSAPLPDIPGETLTSMLVSFPAKARAAPHRHGDAFVYAYVLDGSVRSQLDGQPPQVFHRGENWSEPPGAHHVLTENVSATEEARLLVVFVAPTGAALKSDDPGH